MRHLLLATLCAAGCGRVSVTQDGAVLGDAEIIADAAPPDAPAFGPVDVLFRYYGTPVEAALVFVYDPAGNFLFEATTAADGTVHLEDVPRGGSIYAGKFLGGAPRAGSVYGVQPGDTLVLGDPGDARGTQSQISISSSSATTPHHQDIGAGCEWVANGVTTFPYSLDVYAGCKAPGGWTIVSIAYSDATTASQYAVVQNVNGTVALTGFTQAFNLSDFSLGLSDFLPGATSADARFLFGWPVVGARTQSFTMSGTAGWSYPGGLQPDIGYMVTAHLDADTHSAFERHIAPIRMENVNMTLLMLPFFGSAITGDWTQSARPVLDWTPNPAITGNSEMLLIRAFWDGPGFYDWAVALPASTPPPFQFQAIPTEHVELIPPAGATWFFDATVQYVDATDTTWDGLRQEPARAHPGRTTWKVFHRNPAQ